MSFPVKAVIFDWAGTMIDFGCMAPVHALQAVFEAEGVAITDTEARADMGRAKLDHLKGLLSDPGVAARWRNAKGFDVDDTDIERLYQALQPAMREAAARASMLIPGAALTFKALRDLGVRIGSGTGYTREMMQPILAAAAQQGYAPDVVICAGETPSGRPAPLMTWKALVELDAWPARACIKVDDASVGIEEGRLAGCWTVGITSSGNGVGLTREELDALDPTDRAERLARAAAELTAAGADFIIEDVSQLMGVVEEIARRLVA